MEPDLIGQEKEDHQPGQRHGDSASMEPDLIGQEKGHVCRYWHGGGYASMEPDLIGQEKSVFPSSLPFNVRCLNGA